MHRHQSLASAISLGRWMKNDGVNSGTLGRACASGTVGNAVTLAPDKLQPASGDEASR